MSVPTPESESFLKQTESCPHQPQVVQKFSFEVAKKGDDIQANNYDPLSVRDNENATTYFDTFVHLFKSSVGVGILTMPMAFRSTGVVAGVFLMILVSFMCINCSYVLVKSAHKLYRKTRRSAMSYAEVAELSFSMGPVPVRKFAKIARYTVDYGLFIAYYLSTSAFALIAAQNLFTVFEDYYPNTGTITITSTLQILLIPLIPLCYLPNLKYLAPVSIVANLCMIDGLFVTSWYILKDFSAESLKNVEMYSESVVHWPVFLYNSIFAMMAIGTVMPLENNMKHPKKYLGTFGVLNVTLTIVAVLYFLFGLLGYMTYGKETTATVVTNRPRNDMFARSARLSIGLSVLCGYTLIFYVCHDIVWQKVKPMVGKQQTIANYILRTAMVVLSVSIAIYCQSIKILVAIIGSFFFSILGLILPIFIEIITFWNEGWGLNRFRTYKNIFFLFVSLICLCFGTYDAISDFVKTFTEDNK